MSRIGKALADTVNKRPFVSCLGAGLLMNVLIYCLHARSLVRGASLIFSEPLFFLFNTLIVITFYCVSLLFSRRIFVL